jgi:GDP-L-fucose synthase
VNGSNEVVIWGSGTPLREFLHVDDLAQACLTMMEKYDAKEFLNIGFGDDISIFDLAHLVKEITGFKGELVFDKSKPDGTARKLMDSSKIHSLGWKPQIDLRTGITETYKLFREQAVTT